MPKIKLLDTFAWVGGFHLALEQSIWKENIECIWFSEIDKFAIQVYKEHFPNSKDLWSITELDIDNLEDFDLLTGGFPCQDVSVAWKQNLDWWRTILVEYLLQILKNKPKHFIFENVKWFMSKKFWDFRHSIFLIMKQAGYDIKYEILNTSHFWIPQWRERVFIVGRYWEDSLKDFSFPKWKELTTFLKDILEEEVDEKYYLSEKSWESLKRYDSNSRIAKDICYTLNTMQWWHRQPKIIVDIPAQYWISPTIRNNHWDCVRISEGKTIRKITPTECERLQGFPDWWTSSVSNSQRYKQMWNAISVPVVKAIFDELFSN
jgi:DNA (cytosine-5)-methyltransferase 1